MCRPIDPELASALPRPAHSATLYTRITRHAQCARRVSKKKSMKHLHALQLQLAEFHLVAMWKGKVLNATFNMQTD